MKYFILSFILLRSVESFSIDKVYECKRSISSTPIGELEKNISSCGFQKGLTDFKTIKENHQKYVYQSLAKELSKKINQNNEETALLTSFYYENGDDLLMGRSDTKDQCRLENIKKIQNCGGGKKGPFYEMKLKALKDNLLGGDSSKTIDDLHTILQKKYISNLGITQQVGSELQCPLLGSSGSFILQSQLDEISANEIIEAFSKSDIVSNVWLDKYAQLKLIKNAEKVSPGITEKFKDYLKNKPKNITAKQYIVDFFKDKKIQNDALGPAVAKQCHDINDQVNQFLCSDLDEFGSTDSNVSTKMFNGLDTTPMDEQYAVDFTDEHVLAAYGFQCLANEKKKNGVDPFEKKVAEQTVDDWYKEFNSNTRPEGSGNSNDGFTKGFCDKYLCKSDEVKSSTSCKSGGPLSSADLNTAFNCDKVQCNSDILKSIDYIASLKKIQVAAGFDANNSSSQSPDLIKKNKSILADFAENYLGVEGSLVALGKPLTLASIEEKKQDFKDRGLNSNPPPYEKPNEKNSEFAQKTNEEMFGRDLAQTEQQAIPTTNTASTNYTGNSFMTPTPSLDSTRITGVHSNKSTYDLGAVSESKTADEVAQMKKDLKALSENAQAAPSRSIASEPEEGSNTTASRYDQDYARDLATKDRQLKQRESEVISRENTVWAREREAQRREEELNRKEKEIDEGRGRTGEASVAAAAVPSGGAALGTNTDARSAKLAQDKEDLKASHNGLTVTPDKLQKLDKEDLVNLGVNIEAPFIIRVKVGDKLVSVRVAKVKKENGEAYLEPFMNEDSKEVRSAILRSPIFREFRYYLDQKQSSYSPVKKLKKE